MSDLLNIYGLSEFFVQEALAYPELFVGRVISGHKKLYSVVTNEGELFAEVSGRYRYLAETPSEYPAVGDFVMLDRAGGADGNGIIRQVLPRKSVFMRKAAAGNRSGGSGGQVIAANIDTVCICMAVNYDYNLRRLERYLSIAWESGALPVVVLTKADLAGTKYRVGTSYRAGDIAVMIAETAAVSVGAEVIAVSDRIEGSWEQLRGCIAPGKTIAFTGSSGVGKSTLINRLAGREIADTRELGKHEKGRHTTTRRELILLPCGGLVIDTPGMRELGLEIGDLSQSFADIEALSLQCRFRDCSHGSEPGCAVREAIERGELTPERLGNYTKLEKELKYDGLNSRQIESEKLNAMFGGSAGMKSFRKMVKEMKR